MSKHNLVEFAFARDVVEDYPSIKKTLDNTYKDLYSKKHYMCVQHVLDSIQESQEMLLRQYSYYKAVYEKKGAE